MINTLVLPRGYIPPPLSVNPLPGGPFRGHITRHSYAPARALLLTVIFLLTLR